MARRTRPNMRPTVEEPLTEYEKVRARNMMRNNRMFQSLGIGAIASMIRKTNDVQEGRSDEVQEGSGVINDDPEYNPKEDEVIDGEEVDDVAVKKSVKALKESRTKRPGVKKTVSKKKKSSETSVAMPPGRVMAPAPGQKKRILEPDEPAPDRVTRHKAKMATATHHQESLLRMDSETSVQMGDELPPMDEGTTLRMDGSDAMTTKTRLRKGKGLERITKSLGSKVPIQIAEGMKRPEKPLQEAKLASECGLVARSHLPMNTDSETIKTKCKDILQKNSKNRRHQIKKKYFHTIAANKVSIKSPVPDLTDGQWQALVEMWSTPRQKETCVSNKMNREKVIYNQRTGSRHYTAHIFATKEERKGEELPAIYLFKATHNSKKHGFSEPVKTAIKLERSKLQAEVMQEELAAIKMKTEEAEAARDKELELLRKKSQEQDEKLAHLMALFGAKFVAFCTWQVKLGALVSLGSCEPGSTCEPGSILHFALIRLQRIYNF
ncbi:hypothetical protein VPH35_138732 [Triticum aestivum]